MTIGRIVFKSLRQHALSTCVTAFSIALAGGLLMSVWAVKQQSQATFTGVNGGVRRRARRARLEAATRAQCDFSSRSLAWQSRLGRLLDIRRNPNVELAVPLAVGDNYRGYRLVGTTLDMFEKPNTRRARSSRCNRAGLV